MNGSQIYIPFLNEIQFSDSWIKACIAGEKVC
jgi:hypothetical protein